MKNKKFKLLLTFIFLILSCSMVSASVDVDATDGNLTANVDSYDNLSDSNLVDNKLTASVDVSLENKNSSLGTDNSNLLSDDENSDNEDIGYIVSGDYNGGVTSHGYTIICADEDLNPPLKSTPLSLKNTSILKNSFYGDNVGELLKILFYNYYDDMKDI